MVAMAVRLATHREELSFVAYVETCGRITRLAAVLPGAAFDLGGGLAGSVGGSGEDVAESQALGG